jgi:hypothetical protein
MIGCTLLLCALFGRLLSVNSVDSVLKPTFYFNHPIIKKLIKPHVFKIKRLAVDAAQRRRNPIREFPGLHNAPGH